MKKIFFIFLFILLNLNLQARTETLKGSTSFDVPFKGFFGTWHVTSKIESSTNYSMFNKMSVDIWNLSGSGNVLILENGLTGATSSVTVDDASKAPNGKKLKFTRVKEFSEGNYKYKHIESPEFILDGKIFKGTDTFTVEKYDLNNNLISVDVVKYRVIGQKIAGE